MHTELPEGPRTHYTPKRGLAHRGPGKTGPQARRDAPSLVRRRLIAAYGIRHAPQREARRSRPCRAPRLRGSLLGHLPYRPVVAHPCSQQDLRGRTPRDTPIKRGAQPCPDHHQVQLNSRTLQRRPHSWVLWRRTQTPLPWLISLTLWVFIG